MPTYQWVTPALCVEIDESGYWSNLGNAIDGNSSSYASSSTIASGAAYLYGDTLVGPPPLKLVLPYAMWIDKIKFLYSGQGAGNAIMVRPYITTPGYYVEVDVSVSSSGIIYIPPLMQFDNIVSPTGGSLFYQGVETILDIRNDINYTYITQNPTPIYTDTIQIGIAQLFYVAGERRLYEFAVEQIVPDTIATTTTTSDVLEGTRVSTTRHLTTLSPVIIGA